MILFLDFFSKK